MTRAMPRLVISATRGGSGKTTLTLGIVAAWRKLGKSIAVFKKGPDFIDAGWLGAAAGRPCYNLDLFMMPQDGIMQSFGEHAAGFDAALIEGNRGLYDGVDADGTYSTARLEKRLKVGATEREMFSMKDLLALANEIEKKAGVLVGAAASASDDFGEHDWTDEAYEQRVENEALRA